MFGLQQTEEARAAVEARVVVEQEYATQVENVGVRRRRFIGRRRTANRAGAVGRAEHRQQHLRAGRPMDAAQPGGLARGAPLLERLQRLGQVEVCRMRELLGLEEAVGQLARHGEMPGPMPAGAHRGECRHARG